MALKFYGRKKIPKINEIINNLKNTNKQIFNEEDKTILKDIINDFSAKKTDLLTPQEIRYLRFAEKCFWSEYLIFRWKFKNYPKMRIIPDFPLYLLIEPVSICNLRCRMCWHSDKTFSPKSEFMGMMNFDLFKQIIDEAQKGGTKAITMASRGEPTLHPRFGEMLKYCSKKFFEIKINTNATRFTDELIHEILQNNVDLVVFSVDSYTREGYFTIKGKDMFDTVVKNIKKFNKIRSEFYPNNRTTTRVQGVMFNEELNPEKFYHYWRNLCDQVTLENCERRWDIYNNSLNTECDSPCNYLFERMYIWYDGACNPCDPDYKSYLSIGSLKNDTIENIWKGKKYSALRNAHLERNRKKIIPCDRCFL